MATPVTLKKMEEAKEKARLRKANQGRGIMNPLMSFGGYSTNNYQRNVDFTSSTPRSTQYTSFEPKKGGGGRTGSGRHASARKPMELPTQEVMNAPLGMGTDDYIVDAKTIVCFSGKDHFLSNLSSSPVLIDGHEYQSVEHYYQACKLYSLAGSEYALQLRNINEPVRVKVAAKKILNNLKISKNKIEEWKATQGFIMLNHAMVHKFLQNMELRQKLLNTDDAILVQAYDRDSFYAAGLNREGVEKWANDNQGKIIKIPSELTFENVKYVPLIGKGKNIVGAMCMKIRKMIMELENDKQEVTIDKFLPSLINYLKPAVDAARIGIIANNNNNNNNNNADSEANGGATLSASDLGVASA